MALDQQTMAEVDELISYVGTSGVRFIRNGTEYSGAEGAQDLPDKLAEAGDRVNTTEDFTTGVASDVLSVEVKRFIASVPYDDDLIDGPRTTT